MEGIRMATHDKDTGGKFELSRRDFFKVGAAAATVSTRVFHCPQSPHCPAHFDAVAPHCSHW